MMSALKPWLVVVLTQLRAFVLGSTLVRNVRLMGALRRLYRAVIARLVARTTLFDAAFYAERNPDVVRNGGEAIDHYVASGDFEGRQPMPLFEPAWYRERLGEPIAVNALLHYAWVGRVRGIPPSRWFDPTYYLQNNPDVAAAGVDPLQHFLRDGGREGRSPGPYFDTKFYLRMNPEVEASGVNPLVHWLSQGRAEGRSALPAGARLEDGPAPAEPWVERRSAGPTMDDWIAVTPHPYHVDARIDVVIPVYRGRTETLRCILSALAAPARIAFEVHVIDDASPDPELAQDLRRLAGRGLFTLHVNESNHGFVKTANLGMALHPDRDVVLLNSDTEVFGDWLDRLHRAAYRHPRTGTVTPLSNNATICSYPRTLQDNPHPLEIEFVELDRLAAVHNAGFEAEAPTGHGFCLYLRRDCLADVGAFDEDGFGKGYGEENDLCQRALRRGWRNIIAADVFVRHVGSASFGGERAARVQAALREIGRRFPGYQADVARFCALDPLAPARRSLDWQRLVRQVRNHNTLLLSHGRGGGTERQVQADMSRLAAEGKGVFMLRPGTARQGCVVLSSPAVHGVPNLDPLALSDTAGTTARLRQLGIDQILVHSLVDFGPAASRQMIEIAGSLGVPYDVVVHDYESICPRLTLSDEQGHYCGEPQPAACNVCLKRRGAEFPVTDVRAWREQRGHFLRQARSVSVPDDDVADRLRRYFPELVVDVRPHEDPARLPRPMRLGDRAPRIQGRLRVVVPGAISRHKGYEILRRCAAHARKENLPLEFVVMGYSADDRALAMEGVRVTGRYADAWAVETLRGLEADVVWLPACWPETYSFTLSIALEAGVPVVAFDLGAIARRLRSAGAADHLLPLSAAADPATINAFFLRRLGAQRIAA